MEDVLVDFFGAACLERFLMKTALNWDAGMRFRHSAPACGSRNRGIGDLGGMLAVLQA